MMKAVIRALVGTMIGAISGCAGGASVPATPRTGAAAQSLSPAGSAAWKTFVPSGTSGIYNGITSGPDRATWVADYGSLQLPGGIVKIDLSGKYSEHYLPGLNPEELVSGADENLYFDVGRDKDQVGRLTPAGKLTIIGIPSHDCICGNGMTRGKDGNVWFAETNHVGYVSPAGAVTEYAGIAPGYGVGIAYGPDARIWGTTGNPVVFALTPKTGAVQKYPLPRGCYSRSIVAGLGNVLWFSCQGIPARVGSITTMGGVTTYDITPWVVSEPARDILVAPDGALWFVGQATINGQLTNSVNRLDRESGRFTIYLAPQTHSNFSWDIVQDADRNIWVSSHAGQINVLLSAMRF